MVTYIKNACKDRYNKRIKRTGSFISPLLFSSKAEQCYQQTQQRQFLALYFVAATMNILLQSPCPGRELTSTVRNYVRHISEKRHKVIDETLTSESSRNVVYTNGFIRPWRSSSPIGFCPVYKIADAALPRCSYSIPNTCLRHRHAPFYCRSDAFLKIAHKATRRPRWWYQEVTGGPRRCRRILRFCSPVAEVPHAARHAGGLRLAAGGVEYDEHGWANQGSVEDHHY